MRRSEKDRAVAAEAVSDREVWRRSRAIDAPEDAAAHLLDLAGFAEGRLDEDECDRIMARLARDPAAAADIEAARVLGGVMDGPAVSVERVIRRALPLVADAAGPRVIAFPPTLRRRSVWHAAQWASLAAAIVLASWLGFAMGTDASLDYRDAAGQSVAEDAGYLPGLLDPSTGFMHEIAEDLQT